jgi:serine phosphatase RsbU (regulator of sigma subunit)
VGYHPKLVESLRAESATAELPAAVAMRSGEPVWIESLEQRDARFPELVEMEPSASMCAIPLRIGDRLLGALRFSFSEPKLFDEGERRFVMALAAQAAQALDRAQLYQERSNLYRRLQRSLLPPALPAVPGMELTAVYHPLGDGIEVGGDFYDVWPLGSDEWAFALGDVCGTGPEAAGLSAFVRYSLRGIMTPGADLASLLERLNDVLLAGIEGDGERYCTLIFGTFKVAEVGFQVRLATGGHPEPLLQRADGSIATIPTNGSILGILPTVRTDPVELDLMPGDRLVLYSDGVSEARRAGRMLDTEGLAAMIRNGPVDGLGLAGWIEQGVLDHSGGRLQDDMAVLVLQAQWTAP